MKTLLIPAIALGMLGAVSPATAGTAGVTAVHGGGTTIVRHAGPRLGGRWIWGVRAPGGWGGYRPLTRGWALPGYWIAPRYYISDYRRYGFRAPPRHHGWSRYYDDAVLSDRHGRVVETAHGADWDRDRDFDDRRDHDDRHDGPHWKRKHWHRDNGYHYGGGEIVTETTTRPKTVTVTTITEEWVDAPAPRRRVAPKRSKLLRR